MPTYRIDGPGLELPRVVVAALPAQAIAHVVNDSYTARRIEIDEAFGLAEQGVKLERAGETREPDGDDADGGQLDPGVTVRGADGELVEDESDEGDGAEFEEVEDDDTGAPLDDLPPLSQLTAGGEQFYGEGERDQGLQP